jgi:hypothetical protein
MTMKFVYMNKCHVVFLDEKIEDAEFASIEDVRNLISEINHEINSKWKHADTPITFDYLLSIDLADKLVCKEDVFVWNKEHKEYETIETLQSFDNPSSWKDDEKVGFADILLLWITANDHVYDLYEFLKDMSDDESSLPAASGYSLKLEKLLHKELNNQGILDDLETHYQFRKEDYRKYKEGQQVEEMLNADVQGGIN